MVLLHLPAGEPLPRLKQGLALAHFLGNQHLPLRVAADGGIRVPVEDPAPLLALLASGPFRDVVAEVVPGEAGDPLPNPQAHVHT